VRLATGQFGFPLVSIAEIEGQRFDCLVLGLPFDLHTVTQPGARYGPQFLAETCPVFDWHREDGQLTGLFSYEKRRLLFNDNRVADLGDLDLTQLSLDSVDAFFQDVESWAGLMAERARVPMFIGGDHSLTLPIVNGLQRSRGIETLIILDAHSDFDPFFDKARSPLLHNNFTSHILDTHRDLRILQIGVRDYSLPATRNGDRLTQFGLVSPVDLRDRLKLSHSGGRRGRVHLSVDADVLDPVCFSHVSAPLANGYSFRDLQGVVDVLLEFFDVQSIDIMEICPNRSCPPEQAMWLNYCALEILSATLDVGHA